MDLDRASSCNEEGVLLTGVTHILLYLTFNWIWAPNNFFSPLETALPETNPPWVSVILRRKTTISVFITAKNTLVSPYRTDLEVQFPFNCIVDPINTFVGF